MGTMVTVSGVLMLLFLQTATAASPACPGAAAFLLDGSGSVSTSEFSKTKTFVKHLIRSLLRLGKATQFSVSEYSEIPTTHYYFDDFDTSGSWESQIDSINQSGGWTYAAAAIKHVVQNVFLRRRGSRPNVNKFLIVITDGEATDRDNLPNAISLAEMKGIIRFAIGVGSAFNNPDAKAELDSIASDPSSKHVFQVTTAEALDQIIQTLEDNICPEPPPATTTTTTTMPTPTTTTTTPTPTTPPNEDPELICGQRRIQIGLDLSILNTYGLVGSSGHLTDPRCSNVTERNGTVWYQVDRQADTCGNILTTNNTHAIYSNSLFIYHADNTYLPKRFPFSCVYPLALDTETSLDVPISPNLELEGAMIGVGSSSNGSMSLFQNPNYTEPYPAGPVTLPVGSALYVGVSVPAETDPSFVVVLDDCYATQSNRSDDPMRHLLIQNKCPRNRRQVKLVESGSSLQARFSALLFVFHGDYRHMYLHCSLHLCDQRASSCAPVCSGRGRRSVSTFVPLEPITIGPITCENQEQQ